MTIEKFWIKEPDNNGFEIWETLITDKERIRNSCEDFDDALCLVKFSDYEKLKCCGNCQRRYDGACYEHDNMCEKWRLAK